MSNEDVVKLKRDTNATIIPSGEEHVLEAGTLVTISQALGGSVTIRTEGGLFRIAGKDLDALGGSIESQVKASSEKETQAAANQAFSEDQVWEAMKCCFDPEIPVNVVDLGLIYDLQISGPGENDNLRKAQVKMTLTAQGCGMGPVIAEDVKNSVEGLDAISSATVDIVWDPPWTPHMISEEGRQKLGIE